MSIVNQCPEDTRTRPIWHIAIIESICHMLETRHDRDLYGTLGDENKKRKNWVNIRRSSELELVASKLVMN